MPVALSAWVYFPVTRVFFWADDLFHLGRLTGDGPLPWLITPFEGHNLLVRNLVFLGSWLVFGFHPAAWYGTVLVTHLVNVWLLFRVLSTLTGSAGLACVGATLWGMGPLAGGTLGWYAVFGQALVGTILLFVLNGMARIALHGAPLSRPRAFAWYGLLLAGTTCFGTGIGVALAFPVVLFLILPAAWRDAPVRLAYLALPAITVLLYFACRAAASRLEPLPEAERLQTMVAWMGLGAAPAMVPPLMTVAIAGTVLGHAFDPNALSGVAVLAAVLACVAAVAAVLARGSAGHRRWLLAMVVLALSVYGVLAAGRTSVYGMFGVSFWRAAAEPRYHYVGTIPVVVLLCLGLQALGGFGRLVALPRGPLVALGVALPVVAYARSTFRIDEHTDVRTAVTTAMHDLAARIAAAAPGGTVFIENRGGADPVLAHVLAVDLPGRAGLFLLLPHDEVAHNRGVRFVEPNSEVLAYWQGRPGSRLATLLVSPPAGREPDASPAGGDLVEGRQQP